MCGLRLWKPAIRLVLGGVNEVGKLDCILDKKYGHVIADDVPVSFARIEFYREAAHVPRKIERTLVAGDC